MAGTRGVRDWFANRREPPSDAGEPLDPRAVHALLPGYAPTRLVDAPAIAEAAGLDRVWVKDETSRLGLPSFKILGASYALYRELRARLGDETKWTSFGNWRRAADALGPLTLVTATEGNHGRAVAHLARLLGLDAHVLVPEGTAASRRDAIAGEGAVVETVGGTYDDAIAALRGFGGDRHLVLSDTSWEGYERIPEWVIAGYATIFAEIGAEPELVVVQAGVGALAAAASRAYGASRSRLLAVEPEHAACVLSALRAGAPEQVDGPFDSVMAGLNCGLASAVALRRLRHGLDGVVTVGDDDARAATRLMHASGVRAGPTGAAGAAALLALRASGDDVRAALGVDSAREALVICTEGVTDAAEIAAILAG
jgi:diaminopropionate ammonia-lyase